MSYARRHFVSTHSRLKAAGCLVVQRLEVSAVSIHSRLKAAGCFSAIWGASLPSFNTQPPEGGWAVCTV